MTRSSRLKPALVLLRHVWHTLRSALFRLFCKPDQALQVSEKRLTFTCLACLGDERRRTVSVLTFSRCRWTLEKKGLSKLMTLENYLTTNKHCSAQRWNNCRKMCGRAWNSNRSWMAIKLHLFRVFVCVVLFEEDVSKFTM